MVKSTIRYKIVRGKKRPLCDYGGNCKNLAYREVYPSLRNKKKSGWSHLCRNILSKSRKG